jgi:hypothetical protein
MNQFAAYGHQPPRAGPGSRSEEGAAMLRIEEAASASRDDLHTIDRSGQVA